MTAEPEVYSTEAELLALRASYRPGQQWQYRSALTNGWVDMPKAAQPGWFFNTQYRRKVDEPKSSPV